MADLCEGEERAGFWSLAVEAWFFLYSVSSALRWHPEGTSERQLFLESVNQVRDALNGTSTALILFSSALLAFVVMRKIRGGVKAVLRRSNS